MVQPVKVAALIRIEKWASFCLCCKVVFGLITPQKQDGTSV
ncbi:hypothetical protein JCM19233_6130 [Vibrio astriarenae]|nr:hypothetical protein JCM19233_6130 [Vibrio sp. C7]